MGMGRKPIRVSEVVVSPKIHTRSGGDLVGFKQQNERDAGVCFLKAIC